jgi:hypothetical protein
MRKPEQDGNKERQDRRRHEREDLVQRYRDMQREINALRPPFRGKPTAEIVTMLEQRFGRELDAHTLERSAVAIAAGHEVEIAAPAPPPERPRRSSDRRERSDNEGYRPPR